MNPRDSADPQPASPTDGQDIPRVEPDAPAPRSKAGTPIEVPILSEPTVVLTDPPALLGGASHTW